MEKPPIPGVFCYDLSPGLVIVNPLYHQKPEYNQVILPLTTFLSIISVPFL